jgi:hypothetical protein
MVTADYPHRARRGGRAAHARGTAHVLSSAPRELDAYGNPVVEAEFIDDGAQTGWTT